jgi:hypothetical protein
MYTDSLIEILALLDLSTLHKISFKSKRVFDIYNCDRFWRMKLTNEHLLGHLIDPLYSNSTSKEIYEQHEKYQNRFDILSTALRRHGLNHCYGKIFSDDYECFDQRILSTRLLDQRDDIKTLSICKKNLADGVSNYHKTSMTIIADYVTSKFNNLIYLDISSNCLWFSGKDVNNIHNLKQILDNSSLFINISNNFLIDVCDLSLNERQLRKIIWISEKHIEKLDILNQLESKSKIIKWSKEYLERRFLTHYIPNSIMHMADDIITWHRQFYDIVKPYTPEEDIDSQRESDDESNEK